MGYTTCKNKKCQNYNEKYFNNCQKYNSEMVEKCKEKFSNQINNANVAPGIMKMARVNVV